MHNYEILTKMAQSVYLNELQSVYLDELQIEKRWKEYCLKEAEEEMDQPFNGMTFDVNYRKCLNQEIDKTDPYYDSKIHDPIYLEHRNSVLNKIYVRITILDISDPNYSERSKKNILNGNILTTSEKQVH